MSQLSDFLDRYYPDDDTHSLSQSAPSQSQALSQAAHWCPPSRACADTSAMLQEGRGLKELLQDLMNRSVTKANNPWLHLTPQVSPLDHHPAPTPCCTAHALIHRFPLVPEFKLKARGIAASCWDCRQGVLPCISRVLPTVVCPRIPRTGAASDCRTSTTRLRQWAGHMVPFQRL